MISTGPTWVVAAACAVGACLLGLLVLVRSWRRLPLPVATALALSLLVGFEAILLNGLSLVQAVNRPAVLLGHCLIPVGVLAATRRRFVSILCGLVRWRPGWRHLFLLPLVPLVVLATISAVRYAPNNWDSMTYHLARVAHWIQNRSVAPYPTNNFRQVFLAPGAEYLLLSLQVISGSDRLANLVQLGCFLLVAAAAPVLARLAGAPVALARWAWLLPAAAPAAVLQASSTQNDLVAAVMAIGLIAAGLPHFHPARWPNDSRVGALFLAGAVAAAALVKVTALFAVAPFLLAATVGLVFWGRRSGRGERLLLMFMVVIVILGPEIARRLDQPSPSGMVAAFSYPLWGDWVDRLLNVGRGIWRHLPPPRALVDLLAPFPHRGCGPSDWFCTLALRPHEDYAGNPLQTILILISLGVAAVRWRGVPRRGRYAIAGVTGAYVLMQLGLRDNEWISRLHLPLFALSPVFLAAWPRSILRTPHRRRSRAILVAAGLALLGHGYTVARGNEARLPLWSRPVAYRPSYYSSQWPVRFAHDFTLDRLQAIGCQRLGLFIGGDSYDYPLTWRAMQSGIEVKHVMGSDNWPCAIFSDRGPPPAVPGAYWTVVVRPSASHVEGAANLYVKGTGQP